MFIKPISMISYSCLRKNTVKNNYQTNLINADKYDNVSFSAKLPVFTVNRDLMHTRDINIEDLSKFFDTLFNRKKQNVLRKNEAEALNALHNKIMAIVNEELAKTGQYKGLLEIVNSDARLNIREARYNVKSKDLFIFGGKHYDSVNLRFQNGELIQMDNIEKSIDFEADKNRILMVDKRDTAW